MTASRFSNQFDVNKILIGKGQGTVPVALYRGGKKMDLQVKLAERTKVNLKLPHNYSLAQKFRAMALAFLFT